MKDLGPLPEKKLFIQAENHKRVKFRVREECLGDEKTKTIERDQGEMREMLHGPYIKKSQFLDRSRGVESYRE